MEVLGLKIWNLLSVFQKGLEFWGVTSGTAIFSRAWVFVNCCHFFVGWMKKIKRKFGDLGIGDLKTFECVWGGIGILVVEIWELDSCQAVTWVFVNVVTFFARKIARPEGPKKLKPKGLEMRKRKPPAVFEI